MNLTIFDCLVELRLPEGVHAATTASMNRSKTGSDRMSGSVFDAEYTVGLPYGVLLALLLLDGAFSYHFLELELKKLVISGKQGLANQQIISQCLPRMSWLA